VKKTRRPSSIRIDDRRPSKAAVPPPDIPQAKEPDVEHPTYRGPTKSEKPPAAKQARRAGKVKARFDRKRIRRPRGRAKEIELGDQKPSRRRESTASGGGREEYIRLRIRVRNGNLTVIDSTLVDGPLGQVTGFPGTNAYEVTLGDRLLHAGALPDLGIQRSFANPQGPPEQRGHYITPRNVYEFTARVPAADVTPDTIGRITVTLHRVKEEPRAEALGEMPLATQFERELRPVAELVGLPDSVLPEAIEKRGGRATTG